MECDFITSRRPGTKPQVAGTLIQLFIEHTDDFNTEKGIAGIAISTRTKGAQRRS